MPESKRTKVTPGSKVKLELSIMQALVVEKALDVFTRLSIGQIDIISEMVAVGYIPTKSANTDGNSSNFADPDTCAFVRKQISAIASRLGYSPGSSLGIGNERVPVIGRRAYEVSRVLEKALAEYRDPNQIFRSDSYDGLVLRLTNDPEPKASISSSSESKDPESISEPKASI